MGNYIMIWGIVLLALMPVVLSVSDWIESQA